MKTLKDLSIDLVILIFLVVWFGAGVVVGLRMGNNALEIVPVQAARPLPLSIPGLQVEDDTPVITPAVVETRQARIVTWMYHLDEYGHAIWRQAGEIPAGALVKRSPCLEDGYGQVEYQDPGRPNWWLVQYVRCEFDQP